MKLISHSLLVVFTLIIASAIFPDTEADKRLIKKDGVIWFKQPLNIKYCLKADFDRFKEYMPMWQLCKPYKLKFTGVIRCNKGQFRVECSADGKSRVKGNKESPPSPEQLLLSGASENDLEKIKRGVQQKGYINITDSGGFSLLMYAVYKKNKAMVKYLLKHGIDVNLANNRELTAVFTAITAGDIQVLEILILHGAKLNHLSDRKITPLTYARLLKRKKMAELLLKYGACEALAVIPKETTSLDQQFIKAADRGKLKLMQDLLTRGVNINARDHVGRSALFFAAYPDKIKIAEFLISKGANIHITTIYGVTPLHVATEYGDLKVVQLLIRKGANIHVKDNSGMTPLNNAASSRRHINGQYLIQKGARVNTISKHGYTPLFIAALSGRPEYVRLLLKHGANKELRSRKGQKPLDVARERLGEIQNEKGSYYEKKRKKYRKIIEILSK